MTHFRAVTRTGTVYDGDGRLRIFSPRTGTDVFTPVHQTSIPQERVAQCTSAQELHALARSLPYVEVPVIGERFYAAGFSQWRLSTEVVEVEVLEGDD